MFGKKIPNPDVKEVDRVIREVLFGCIHFYAKGNWTAFNKDQFLKIYKRLDPKVVFREKQGSWILYHFIVGHRVFFLELREKVKA